MIYSWVLTFGLTASSGSVAGFATGDPCLTAEMEAKLRAELEPLRGRPDGLVIVGSSDTIEYRRGQGADEQPRCVTLQISPEIRGHHRLGLLRASAVFEVCRRMELPQCAAKPLLVIAGDDGTGLSPPSGRAVLSATRTAGSGPHERRVDMRTIPPARTDHGADDKADVIRVEVIQRPLPPPPPPPPPPPSRQPVLLRGIGGGLLALGAAEGAAGGLFLYLASAQRAATLHANDPERSLLLEEDGYRYARAGIALTAVSIGTVVAGVVLVSLAKRVERRNSTRPVRAGVAVSDCRLTLRF